MGWTQYSIDGAVKSVTSDIVSARAKYVPGTTGTIVATGGAPVKIALAPGDIEFDTHNFLDNANDRLVIPNGMGGLYQIIGAVEYPTNATGNRFISVTVNGTTRGFTNELALASISTRMQCGALVELAEGDYVELNGAQTSGGNLTVGGVGNAGTFLSIIRHSNTPAPVTSTDFQAARAKVGPSAAGSFLTSTSTKITLGPSAEYDTDGFLDTVNDRLTVPAGLDGLYRISGAIVFSPNATGHRVTSIKLNGANILQSSCAGTSGSFSTVPVAATSVELVAGDYIELWASQNSGATLSGATGIDTTQLCMERISGAPTPTQTQQPQARATTVVATPLPSGSTVIPLATEQWDTDNLHSTVTNTGRMTITTPGLYQIDGSVLMSPSATGAIRLGLITVNGTVVAYGQGAVTASAAAVCSMSTQWRLNATDFIEMFAQHDVGAGLTVNVVGATTHLAVSRISA